jgi:TetR/AcrR family transcriptional regulator, mexJK operon transcriptional repressor
VYKHFADKERLLRAVVLGTLDRAGEPIRTRVDQLAASTDLPADLRDLARDYLATVMRPPVQQLRRLVVSEAGRLPQLAREYYERAPERTIETLAACFGRLAGRGLLRAGDPRLAASHFAFLVLGRALDQSLFCGAGAFTAAELTALADAGSDAFLRAYQPDPAAGAGARRPAG